MVHIFLNFSDFVPIMLLSHLFLDYRVKNSPAENSQKTEFPLLTPSNICARKHFHADWIRTKYLLYHLTYHN